jgi:hypothetical protein
VESPFILTINWDLELAAQHRKNNNIDSSFKPFETINILIPSKACRTWFGQFRVQLLLMCKKVNETEYSYYPRVLVKY